MSHEKYLDAGHQLRPRVRDVKAPSELSMHMVIDHAVSPRGIDGKCKSKRELARQHLLAHAVEAFPELRELLGLSKEWGRG